MPLWRRLSALQRSAVIAAPALVAATLAMTLLLPQPLGGDDTVLPPDIAARTTGAPDTMADLVQAHLEARTSQPLIDQGHVRLLLVDPESRE
jgi:hypothetical protein